MLEKEFQKEYSLEQKEIPKIFFHFSLQPLEKDFLIVGLKAVRKSKQRIGQRVADEIFEKVRKKEFPLFPSIFSSLWVTDVYDPSIARKAFEENPEVKLGYLYQVEPVGKVIEVDAETEIEVCRAVTQSKLKGGALVNYLEEAARKFWQPKQRKENFPRCFLCPEGAKIVRLVRIIKKEELIKNKN
jgi:hypothetical protein